MVTSPGEGPPSWIGKYEVLEKIGEGGFAVVYKARDPFIKRLVAIKVCVSEDAELRERFYREAQIAGNLHHPNVVTVFDFGTEESRPYLVQEYLAGEDLKAQIQRRDPLTAGRRLSLLLQVAQGLAYAHGKGVLHRDVKPSNVRVLPDGSAKLMDFGIAKLEASETMLTKRGSVLGTAGYLPPEQVLGREADVRSDVFSFGALAYELLSYEVPFPGDTVSEVLQQVLSATPPPLAERWPACPPDLAALVSRCLQKDPAQRFAGFDEVIAELAPIVERAERRAAPAGKPKATVRPSLDDTVPIPPDSVDQVEAAEGTQGALRPPRPPPWRAAAAGGAAIASRWGAMWRRSTVLAPGGHRPPWITVAALAAVALFVVAVLAGLWLARRTGSVEPPAAGAVSRSPDGVPPAPGETTGLLVVDARPWAEIQSLVDGDGNPLPLPPEPYTPLSLRLPPGSYRLSLSHPFSAQPGTCAVEMAAGGRARCQAELGEVDVVDYFKESGWWR